MKADHLIEIVNKTHPDITISDVKFKTNGWDNDIIILNNEVVFRFPKSEGVASKVKDEMNLTRQLALKNPLLQIPRYEPVFLHGEFKGVKYEYLNGETVSDSDHNYLLNQQNANLLGDFLTKLHSIDLSMLRGTNIVTVHTQEYWEDLYHSVVKYIFPNLKIPQRVDIQNLFENFLNSSTFSTYNKVLIHGDLTTSNMLFQKEKQLVSGIIDFTDAQVGDPAFDFAGFYWSFGPDFTREVVSHYQTEDSESIFKRVQCFYGLQPIFHNLLYAVRENQLVNWDTALDRFAYLYALKDKK
ncbi:aminoglycoside phosphotransferase family protein [Bacillus salacetis]|uniref:aminoglycoside phosphotransferase family protein n=1 Tax=Bacillus salacetis TaxID=2315464 RepID=UPI003BA21D4D